MRYVIFETNKQLFDIILVYPIVLVAMVCGSVLNDFCVH